MTCACWHQSFSSNCFSIQIKTIMALRLFTNTYLKRTNAEHYGWCFKCHEEVKFPEIVIVCEYEHCPHTFHLECMQITELPSGKWICPWHKCAEENCNEPPILFCKNCPKAICQMHSPSSVTHNCNWYVFILQVMFVFIFTNTCPIEILLESFKDAIFAHLSSIWKSHFTTTLFFNHSSILDQ